MHLISIVLFLCFNLYADVPRAPADDDGDGLPDSFEQAILTRFVPLFHVSDNDCDIAPAEFERFSREPVVRARNGTIYGQVFPARGGGNSDGWIEVHYFHLWGSDCGSARHPLDAEAVSALLRGSGSDLRAEAWEAVYWYAAAHEDTLCDMSNAATAVALEATDGGPKVWVSRDKHASFLNKDLCERGCGKDRCEKTSVLQVRKIINLGEPGAPLAGSEWLSSQSWTLVSKMQPDFTDSLIARIPQGGSVQLVPSRDVAKGTRNTIKVAANTYSSLDVANTRTGSAIAAGAEGARTGLNAGGSAAATSLGHANRSLRNAAASTATSVRKAFRWILPRKPARDAP
jgi:hypothetical protein